MLALWQVAVDETRALLDRLVGRRVASRAEDRRCDCLIWGAGAIGGTLGRVPRARRPRRHDGRLGRRARGRHQPRRPAGHRTDRRVHARGARLHARDAHRRRGTRSCSRRRRITPRPPFARSLPHLTADGCVVSAQNGLNELAIAEVVGRGAHGRRVRQLRRRLPRAGRDSLRRPRRGGRRRDRRTDHAARHRAPRRVARLRRARHRHAEHLGLSLGQGGLRRDALRHRAHERVDRRRARDAARIAHCTSRWRARSSPSPRRAASRPRRSTASIRRRISRARRPARRERSLDALVAHNRRSAKSHSGIWRDLAVRKRPTEVDAQLGIVVTLGAEAGVATPLTARLVELIHEIERGARPQSLETLDALARHAAAHGPRMNVDLHRQDRHRHRRGARLRPRHQPGVRRARRARLGLRRDRRRAARDGAALPGGGRHVPRGARRRARPAAPWTPASPRRPRRRAASTSW